MRRRPWALVLLAFLHIIAPIGNIVFNALITNKDVFQYLVFAMSPQYLEMNWPIIVGPIAAGVAIYACKKWSFYVYIAIISYMFVFSYSGYQSKAESLSLLPVLLVYLINISVVAYFLIPAVRNVYFDRRMRWWEVQARYKCNIPAQWWNEGDSAKYSGVIGNLSENGLFLKSDETPGDQVNVVVSVDGKDVEVKGKTIIHKSIEALGFGVQFEHSKESKKMIRSIVENLEQHGERSNPIVIRPEDSFSFWVRTLVTTGKGLLPKNDKRS